MHQEVTLNLTYSSQLKEREEYKGNSSLRNTAGKENCSLKELLPLFPNCCSSEEEDYTPPVLKRFSEVLDDLESCCSPRSPPDLSIPGVSVMKTKEENISTNNAGLRGVNKDGLDSYSFPERDKIDGKMFYSFLTQEDLESFPNGRASYQGEKLTNQFSASKAELTSIKHISKREMKKSRPLYKKNIAVFAIDVFAIDDYADVNETSPSGSSIDSNSDDVMIVEYHNVKPDGAENGSTKLDPESPEPVILDGKIITPDKRELSFPIIPEETYFVDCGIEKIQPSCEKNIPVFTIDDDDVNETSPSASSIDSDREEVMITEYQTVKPDDAENGSKLDPESPEPVILHRKRNLDKRESSFLIIPEEAYFEDYDVPSPLKRVEFHFVVECDKRCCTMGCVCSSLNTLKPRLQRCNHLECIFDNGCIKKSKLTDSVTLPSSATEDDTFEGLPQLSRKKEVNLQNEIDELTIRLLQKDEEIEKLRKIIDQQAVLLESKNIMPIKVAKAEEYKMVNGKRVQDGLFVDCFPLKENMLNRLAKNTTASLFIRQLMREMYTPEYCSSKTFRLIKQEHVMAIIEATKERFSVYRGKNGSESKLTEEKIKLVMKSVLNMAKQAKVKKISQLSLKPS